MTLKALLLGSAAAMIAVSGARAADAVIAEPEAVDYVKVCDMYGAGFFYIPGTETCLKISGYARVDYTYENKDDYEESFRFRGKNDPAPVQSFQRPDANGNLQTYRLRGTTYNRGTGRYRDFYEGPKTDSDENGEWGYRLRVNFDARNETEYGTLRSQLRIQGDGEGDSDGNVAIDRALISLGGLRVGYSDTYWSTNNSYGLPVAINDGYYGFDQSVFLDYTFAANGFAFTVGVEDPTADSLLKYDDARMVSENYDGATHPNFYGGMEYSGSWGRVAATVAYDSYAEDTAYSVNATFNLFEGFALEGFYAGDGGDDTVYVSGAGEYAWGVGVSYAATSALDLYAGYGDRDEGDYGEGDQDYFNVGANYDITTGLRIQGEVNVYDDSQTYQLRVQRDF